MERIFGKEAKLIDNTGNETAVSSLSSYEVVGLYFSAHWCPPCRGFTPRLASTYKNLQEKGKSFVIVFISSDKDIESFKEYHSEMPWLALSFEERELKAKLSRRFKVTGIPSLIFLNGASGKVITKNGRRFISEDPNGEKFPWNPPSLFELLGDKVIDHEGGETDLKAKVAGKTLGLYFSAHWCPPCKKFTPILCDTYKKIKESKEFEIIFVSADRDEKQFQTYFQTMPWLALPFSESHNESLSSYFDVDGIPTLVLIDSDGNIITKEGYDVVGNDKDGKNFPWAPKAVKDIESCAELNSSACVVVLADECPPEERSQISDDLTKVAEEFIAKARKMDEDAECVFTLAAEAGTVASKIRTVCKVESDKTCKMLILDVGDDGAYYSFKGSTIDRESISKFVIDFQEGKLEKQTISID
ncbi:hypothetical protein GUITHDRAFT_98062 [Guillardia theta CCMP2712]|uniref:Thioredoxin domain-containing protein n=1 Tax=Guillardia theta (strain CCMP2712) TaxID=905079 RepID=L1IE54_GUITC|nr:hypothetical protein GUITHDRAFT_98062 [Guillardia theta CCMP2712]EKX34508.1 hypothetical protein GUITHDRAFT_98062 [Guillardia theta CCMP2712]|mmetsp:Transcript_451/g.992  ORF Transcript_451/g.992 Transcript_451/m.992 type:complete len:416 (-) Transcript_451:668-1915(-)|eukprot:XP_005821488.1 hypothetical protein GUITHDRAFT_98062 [Guillardia theta CCMP2712]